MQNITTSAVTLSQELQAFTQAVHNLPKEHQAALEDALQRVTATHVRRTKLMKAVDEAVTELRTNVKFLQFDLEATRQERDEFKAALESRGF